MTPLFDVGAGLIVLLVIGSIKINEFVKKQALGFSAKASQTLVDDARSTDA